MRTEAAVVLMAPDTELSESVASEEFSPSRSATAATPRFSSGLPGSADAHIASKVRRDASRARCASVAYP